MTISMTCREASTYYDLILQASIDSAYDKMLRKYGTLSEVQKPRLLEAVCRTLSVEGVTKPNELVSVISDNLEMYTEIIKTLDLQDTDAVITAAFVEQIAFKKSKGLPVSPSSRWSSLSATKQYYIVGGADGELFAIRRGLDNRTSFSRYNPESHQSPVGMKHLGKIIVKDNDKLQLLDPASGILSPFELADSLDIPSIPTLN